MNENQLSNLIIGAAIDVHSLLGPGLLESAYESALACELELRQIPYERQKAIQVLYKGNLLDAGFRVDLLAGGLVIVELKAVDTVSNLHKAQVITYLKLTGCKLGLLFNFNVLRMREGIHRIAFGLP